MTPSPELIHELRASRPSAPAELRARVRAVASERPIRSPWASWRFPLRRGMLVAVPAAAALAIASAGQSGGAREVDAPGLTGVRHLDGGERRRCRPNTGPAGPVDDRPARAARQRDAHGGGEGRERRVARSAERARPDALARRLCRRLVRGDG